MSFSLTLREPNKCFFSQVNAISYHDTVTKVVELVQELSETKEYRGNFDLIPLHVLVAAVLTKMVSVIMLPSSVRQRLSCITLRLFVSGPNASPQSAGHH